MLLLDQITGLVTEDDLKSELRRRRSKHNELSVPLSEEESRIAAGWELVRRNRNSIRIRRLKPVDQGNEDETWTLFALMGFDAMNAGRHFVLPVGREGSGIPPKQIDVLAADSETIFVVECKASNELRNRSLHKDLAETHGLKQAIGATLRRHFGNRQKVCFVYSTRNVIWSRPDLARAEDYQIFVLNEKRLEYYRQLVDLVGPAARHQLQADVLQGTAIPGLRVTVPALRGRFGDEKFYQFAIEPEKLLKLAYVSHRANIDAETIGTYQRMLKKKRIRDIADYINDTRQGFPTNIVINFRTKRALRFDAGQSIGDDQMSLGTLYLPNTYKSAWVIDGQHRLYGFALSDWASKIKVPVLAFENLDPQEETRLFVDINNKQVSVPRRLLVQLYGDIHWDADDPASRLRALHSRLASELSDSSSSPLFNKVVSEWERQTDDRPITLPQLMAALVDSETIGVVRNGVLDPGIIYEEASIQRAAEFFEAYFGEFQTALPDHWNLGRHKEAFLCTNQGLIALSILLRAIVGHVQATEDVDFYKMTPSDIVSKIRLMIEPVIKYIEQADESMISGFKGHYGSSGPRTVAFALMEIVHDAGFSQFRPPGLDEHIRSHSEENVNKAQDLVRSTEDVMREIALTALKRIHGSETDQWWRSGVPQPVRMQAAQLVESSQEGGDAHEFLTVLDYKKIAETNCEEFRPFFTIDNSKKSKRASLEWMDRFNGIRNRVSHSGRRRVTNEEIDFLEDAGLKLLENQDSLGKLPDYTAQ